MTNGAWLLVGNDIDPDQHFLGTTTEKPLIFKVNNVWVMTIDTSGNVTMPDKTIFLREGGLHGLGWYSDGFAGTMVDGPVLFGWSGGALGTTASNTQYNEQRIALHWDSENNVKINGNLEVTGDVVLTNADCAEDFDIAGAASVQPGSVMVLDSDGALQPSQQPYDKRVAGVISGAGDLHPGITLDKHDTKANRLPLALTGKVYCLVDADYGSVEVGDLLTTSSTPGHAMKADDPARSFGAVIGKAVQSLKAGRSLIPMLVALQ
ncbi:MAG: hypothetical protein ACXVIP_05320 [Halobacteriota archaeon]